MTWLVAHRWHLAGAAVLVVVAALWWRRPAKLAQAAVGPIPEAAIVVIAPPRTLGEIRKHYGRASQARLAGEIDKDLAGHVTDDIVRAIAAHEG